MDEAPQLQYLARAAAAGGAVLTGTRPKHAAACLLPVADCWVLLATAEDETLTVNQLAVVGFKILEHGDTIQLPDLRLRLSEERIEVLTPEARLIQQKKACPVCQRDFAPGDRVLYCARCNLAHHTSGSPQHDDCLSFNGKCASSPFCGSHQRPRSAVRPSRRVDP
jgi:hypothetical protein